MKLTAIDLGEGDLSFLGCITWFDLENTYAAQIHFRHSLENPTAKTFALTGIQK
jgi:hypothetical protein